MYKIHFGRGFVWTTEVSDIQCPNQHGGIGDCTVEGELWTGDIWMYGRFQLPFGSITVVETRSTLDETDEPWVEIWRRPKQYAYEPWMKLARMLQ